MKIHLYLKSVLKLRYVVSAAVMIIIGLMVAFFSSDYYEALKFGYQGPDLSSDGDVFFSVGNETNYLPRRVMINYNKTYDLTEDEKAVTEVLGILEPNAGASVIPEGYRLRDSEPMFVTYVKEAKALGFEGTAGVVAKYDEEIKRYFFCESFFSVYCDSKEEALKKLQQLSVAFAAECKPLKMYNFNDSWAAEYRRYCVLCVIGMREDGSWSVMINVRDKSASYADMWIPVEEQLEMIKNQEKIRGALK